MSSRCEGLDDDGCISTDENFSDLDSDTEAVPSIPAGKQVCRYYNKGGCRYSSGCRDLHLCQYFLRGNCRYGNRCTLNHHLLSDSDSTSDEDEDKDRRRAASDSGRPYCWQLNSGRQWKDIANDHILEVQYSRPNTKGINIYNTRYGAISIDFNHMTVREKAGLQVRRLDSGQTEWVWYCSGDHGWVEYSKQDSRGNSAPTKSSDIEKVFQARSGPYRFTRGNTKYLIHYEEMYQENLSTHHKRRVVRRPRFTCVSAAPRQGHGGKVIWEFAGNGGKWYRFKHRRSTNTQCSVSSDSIEKVYQQNPHGSMPFTIGGTCYRLDFSAMLQTNLSTNNTRPVRRVKV